MGQRDLRAVLGGARAGMEASQRGPLAVTASHAPAAAARAASPSCQGLRPAPPSAWPLSTQNSSIGNISGEKLLTGDPPGWSRSLFSARTPPFSSPTLGVLETPLCRASAFSQSFERWGGFSFTYLRISTA